MKAIPFLFIGLILFTCTSALGKENEFDSFSTANLQFMQNIRPFASLKLEYLVETAEINSSTWKLSERHRLLLDNINGFSKISSLKEFVTTRGTSANWLSYSEESWNGEKKVNLTKHVQYNKMLNFENLDNRQISVSISGMDYTSVLSCPIVRLYTELRFDKSLYSVFNNPEKNKIKITPLPLGRTLFLIENKGIEIIANNQGLIEERKLRGWDRVNEKIYYYNQIKVEKYLEKNGRKFPEVLICIYQNKETNHSLKKRFTILPETLEINPVLAASDFTTEIPAGASVINHITNARYIASELDPFAEGADANIAKDLDALVESIKKEQKNAEK